LAVLLLMLAILFWLSVFLIIYTYIGYPVLISLIAKLIPFPGRADGISDISVTLLITAYNEEAVIEKKIENSLRLEYPRERLQIIVAADGSSDRTPEIVGKFASFESDVSDRPILGLDIHAGAWRTVKNGPAGVAEAAALEQEVASPRNAAALASVIFANAIDDARRANAIECGRQDHPVLRMMMAMYS